MSLRVCFPFPLQPWGAHIAAGIQLSSSVYTGPDGSLSVGYYSVVDSLPFMHKGIKEEGQITP